MAFEVVISVATDVIVCIIGFVKRSDGPFLIFSLNSDADEEAAEKRANAIIDEMKKQGELQKIIKEACELSEEALTDFGRAGKRGFQAFVTLTEEKDADPQRGRFKESVKARISGPENLSSALEEILMRQYPAQLGWSRTAVDGPTIKMLAHRMTYVTGEIVRRSQK